MPWKIQTESTFYRQLKKLDSETLVRFDKAVRDLANATDPRKLGSPKKGQWHGYYGYELGRSYRLIYKVLDNDTIIIWLQ